MNYDLKSIFLELLDDKDVRDSIIKIFNENKLKEDKKSSKYMEEEKFSFEKYKENINSEISEKNLEDSKKEYSTNGLKCENSQLEVLIKEKNDIKLKYEEKLNLTKDLENENNTLKEKNKKLKNENDLFKERIKNLEKEISDLKEREKDLRNKLDILNKEKLNLSNRNKDLEDKLENKISENEILNKEDLKLKKRIEKLKSFEKWTNIYEKYKSLSGEVRNSLSGIFKGDDIPTFIYCGLQENNINNLWEYMKSLALNGEEEVCLLSEIFFNFFDAYNLIYENPLYQKQNVQIGDEFDDELYIRTSGSNPAGNIKKIILEGYILKSNKKIIKKSIVEL